MAIIIEMPKLSDTMTVGTLVSWLKKEGDTVSSGDMIAEIETDKATMEMEAVDDGIVLKQLEKPGEQVEIRTPLAAIGAKGDALDPALLEKKKPATATEKPKDDKQPQDDSPGAEAPAQPPPPPTTEAPARSHDKRLRAPPHAR